MTPTTPRRGEIWRFRAARLPVLVVQSDALSRAPTVIGLLVTPTRPRAGEPLSVAVAPERDDVAGPAWVKVNQVHTWVAADAVERVGRLHPDTRRRVETALARVLGLATPPA